VSADGGWIHAGRDKRSTWRSIAAAAAAVASVATGTAARAETPEAKPLNEARALFLQAESDEDGARWQEALTKLRRVASVRSTAGVRYHIALCEEQLGRLADALADYALARDQARDERVEDVSALVGNAIARLGPRVAHLTIRVREGANADVTLDGAPVPRGRLGETLPVDPGLHRIDVRVGGVAAGSAIVDLHERDSVVVELPLPSGAGASPTPEGRRSGDTKPAPGAGPADDAARAMSAATRAGAAEMAIAAVILAAVGAGAYMAADSALDSGIRSCATVRSAAADACDSQKTAVRTWDWVAGGSWVGAAVSSGVAIWLWTRPAVDKDRPGSSQRRGSRVAASRRPSAEPSTQWVVGPLSIGVVGRF
jgi:hypothetical protein